MFLMHKQFASTGIASIHSGKIGFVKTLALWLLWAKIFTSRSLVPKAFTCLTVYLPVSNHH